MYVPLARTSLLDVSIDYTSDRTHVLELAFVDSGGSGSCSMGALQLTPMLMPEGNVDDEVERTAEDVSDETRLESTCDSTRNRQDACAGIMRQKAVGDSVFEQRIQLHQGRCRVEHDLPVSNYRDTAYRVMAYWTGYK